MAISLTETGITFKYDSGTESYPTSSSTNPFKKAIFTLGINGSSNYSTVSTSFNYYGIVETDVTRTWTGRNYATGVSFGYDRGLIAFGIYTAFLGGYNYTSNSNMISNLGDVQTEVTNASVTARYSAGAVPFGNDKGLYCFGLTNTLRTYTTSKNQVSNVGVIAGQQESGVGGRSGVVGVGYGGDKGIYAFGEIGSFGSVSAVNTYNLVSNTGELASDSTAASATARADGAGVTYGGDKAMVILGYAYGVSAYSTKVIFTNLGTPAGEYSGATTARYGAAGASYGSDTAVIGFGTTASGSSNYVNTTNLISNGGSVAAEISTSGVTRYSVAAASFGQ